MQNKKLMTLSVLGLALLLTSCGTTETIKAYPDNNGDNLVAVPENIGEIFGNNFKNYYDKLIKNNKNTSSAMDFLITYLADKVAPLDAATISEEANKKLLEKAKSSSYEVDGKFNEYKLVMELRQQMYSINCGNNESNLRKGLDNKVILPTSKISDILVCDYSDYVTKYLTKSIKQDNLTVNYIYNEQYKNIGNTNARKVNFVKITDRDDKPGLAAKTINAFIEQVIKPAADKKALTIPEGVDQFDVLADIWKGTYNIEGYKTYTPAFISALDKFVKDNGLETKYDAIEEEIAKIDLADKNNTDISLEDKYTSNKTHSVEKGKDLAVLSLAKTDLTTNGTYLKSDGLTDLPDAIRKRIFSANYNIDSSSTKNDVTITMPDGKRYLTQSVTESGVGDEKIYHYDADSKSYYIIEIQEVVTARVLEVNSSDSDDVKAKKEKLAKSVAKEMVTKSTYAADAIVKYVRDYTVTYHDDTLLTYLKSNYANIFLTDEEYKDLK